MMQTRKSSRARRTKRLLIFLFSYLSLAEIHGIFPYLEAVFRDVHNVHNEPYR